MFLAILITVLVLWFIVAFINSWIEVSAEQKSPIFQAKKKADAEYQAARDAQRARLQATGLYGARLDAAIDAEDKAAWHAKLIADPAFGSVVTYWPGSGRWAVRGTQCTAPDHVAEKWAAAHPDRAALIKDKSEASSAKWEAEAAVRAAARAARAAALKDYANNEQLRAEVRAGRVTIDF